MAPFFFFFLEYLAEAEKLGRRERLSQLFVLARPQNAQKGTPRAGDLFQSLTAAIRKVRVDIWRTMSWWDVIV